MTGANVVQYGCTLKELRELMTTRGHEAIDKINADYGTVQEICKRLYTNSNDGKYSIYSFAPPVYCFRHYWHRVGFVDHSTLLFYEIAQNIYRHQLYTKEDWCFVNIP